MKDLLKVVGSIVFYAFVVAVAVWVAMLTISEMKELLPNDPLTPYFALALFDGGALAWLLVFMYVSRGLPQRAVSVIMLVLDLLGAFMISGARIITGGQAMTAIPEGLGLVVVYGVTAYTALNLAAIYAYHVTEPENLERIETQTLEDKLTENALKQATEQLEREAQELGYTLSQRVSERVKRNLKLLPDPGESSPPLLIEPTKSTAPLTQALGLFARRKEPAIYASETIAPLPVSEKPKPNGHEVHS